MKKNDLIEAEITGMTDMGYGVARIDGLVTFVDGGVTGDKLLLKIIKIGSGNMVGRTEEIITPSPYRKENLCVRKRCGGCAFGNITDEYELELKRDFVKTAFKKQGLDIEVKPVITDGRRIRYRNKVQIPVENGVYGYYAKHSHTVTDCSGCILAPEIFDEITAFVVSLSLPLRHVCIRMGEMTGEIMLTLVTEKEYLKNEKETADKIVGRFPAIKSIVINTNPDDTNVILGKKCRAIYGEDIIYDVLCNCRFGISSRSFYQVNRNVAELLYNYAIDLAAGCGPKKVTDLFCGAGTIGLSMAKKYPNIEISGVEIVPEAIENAKINAKINGIENAVFKCGDASGASVKGADCVIVDPPRKGLTPELIKTLNDENIETVVYVSCNPETLARDCAIFKNYGYQISPAQPFDMFPRTGHVETVVLVSKANPKG